MLHVNHNGENNPSQYLRVLLYTDGQDENVQAKVNESHILQERRIGIFGAVSLIVNKIVGAGYVNYSIGSEKVSDIDRIFSTPGSIFKLSGSPGMALILWVIAGAISTCGAMVMLEFGTIITRSGGMKIYLERSFSPKLLMTCIYLFYCVFLRKFLLLCISSE